MRSNKPSSNSLFYSVSPISHSRPCTDWILGAKRSTAAIGDLVQWRGWERTDRDYFAVTTLGFPVGEGTPCESERLQLVKQHKSWNITWHHVMSALLKAFAISLCLAGWINEKESQRIWGIPQGEICSVWTTKPIQIASLLHCNGRKLLKSDLSWIYSTKNGAKIKAQTLLHINMISAWTFVELGCQVISYINIYISIFKYWEQY